jgi:hypothetical protein
MGRNTITLRARANWSAQLRYNVSQQLRPSSHQKTPLPTAADLQTAISSKSESSVSSSSNVSGGGKSSLVEEDQEVSTPVSVSDTPEQSQIQSQGAGGNGRKGERVRIHGGSHVFRIPIPSGSDISDISGPPIVNSSLSPRSPRTSRPFFAGYQRPRPRSNSYHSVAAVAVDNEPEQAV